VIAQQIQKIDACTFAIETVVANWKELSNFIWDIFQISLTKAN